MAEQTRDAPSQGIPGRPDSLYVLVAGLYVGILVTPAILVALGRSVTDAASLYVGFLVAFTTVSAIVGWIVSSLSTIAVRLGRTDVVWLLVVLPVGWGVVLLGVAALGRSPPASGMLAAVVSATGGMFFGIALVAMSRTRHAAAAVADTTEQVAWEARWPARWRRLAAGILIVTFGLGIAGIAAVFAFGREWGWSLCYIFYAGIPFMNLLNPRRFGATATGLVVGNPVQRQFRAWSAFDGYERTDDTLVIRSGAWWRPALRCDVGDIENVDAVVGALETVFTQENERRDHQ